MTDPEREDSGGDEYVGYGRPPKSGQFVKGRSGNPRGRPRRLKAATAGMFSDSDFDRMFLEEMKRQVTVREGDKVEKTTIECAAVRAIALKAAKGDARAYRAVADKRVAIDGSYVRGRLAEILKKEDLSKFIL